MVRQRRRKRCKQSGGRKLPTVFSALKKSLGGAIANKALDRADGYLTKVIKSKVKNKTAQDLITNQLKALKPFLKKKIDRHQKGGIRRRYRKGQRLRSSTNQIKWF